jgi:hypothetical protein
VPAFLRFDRPELTGGALVIRAVPDEVRQRRRHSDAVPLAYLYEVVSRYEPDADVVMTAGHYDTAALVWRFSGELAGITGITEPLLSGPNP